MSDEADGEYQLLVTGDTGVGKTNLIAYLGNPGIDGDKTFNAVFNPEHEVDIPNGLLACSCIVSSARTYP